MFREKLKKDLGGISPDEELLIKVTKAMQEEAQKPRPNIYRRVTYFGGMAAAVCMIAVGAVALNGGIGVVNETMTADSAQPLEMNESSKAAQGDTAEFYFAEAEMAVDEACEEISADDTAGAPESGYIETEAPSAYAEEPATNVTTVYKGENIDLTEQDAQEIINTAEKYMEENSFQLLDLMLSPDDIEEIGRNGLSFKAEYEDGSYTALYIDNENSYACKKFNTYFFGGEDKEYILSFFE